MGPRIVGLARRYPNVVVRKVDIVSWESDAFRVAKEDFGVNAIPFMELFGKDGKDLGSFGSATFDELEKAIAAAK